MKSLGLATLLAALFIAGCAPVPPATVAPTSGPLSIGEHAPTLNGVRMWYRVAGRPTGVPVIFIAGGPGGNHYEFATLAGPSLEPSHRMIYFDGRGVGKSERPASADYRIATLIDDIEALRVHLGVPRIAIIAHSFGGLLGLNYAAKYPGSLSALVVAGGLWDPVLSCRERAEFLAVASPAAYARLMANGRPPDDKICEAGFRAVPREEFERVNNASMFPKEETLRRQKAAQAESGLKNTGELSRAVFSQGFPALRFRDLDKVRAPVLVVAGGKDFAAGPAAQRALAATLPNGQLVEYPDYGHWMFIDDPDRFASDVTRFLRRVR